MQQHHGFRQDLGGRQEQRSLGFTGVDFAAHLFAVSLLVLSFPIFWQPPTTSTSSNNYRSRAVLPVRLVLER